MEKNIRPQFGKSFRGYQPKQVNDYIARLESELEIVRHQQEKFEHEALSLRADVERMKNQVNTAWTEAETMRSKNSQLNASIQELEAALRNQKDEQVKLQMENRRLKETADECGHNPQTIKDAILNAQRMGEIIVQEANDHAKELRAQADQEYSAAQDEMNRMIQDKNNEAQEMMDSAYQKCENLQREYDHILMDVSGFKAEMIALYRRHLELLYKLPDNGMLPQATMEISSFEEEPFNGQEAPVL